MKNIALSPHIFQGLLEHLVDLEERQARIMEDLSLNTNGEQQEYTSIFKSYLHGLRKLVGNAQQVEGNGDGLPVITIGSLVQVRNSNNQREHTFHIVSPHYKRTGSGDVSCLSPMGRALLLRQVGEAVEVQAPGGIFQYQIESIRYTGE